MIIPYYIIFWTFSVHNYDASRPKDVQVDKDIATLKVRKNELRTEMKETSIKIYNSFSHDHHLDPMPFNDVMKLDILDSGYS